MIKKITQTSYFLLALSLIISCQSNADQLQEISSNLVRPTTELIRYQQMELIGFIHFTVNTFTDKEWGYGDEDPQIFNPTALDVEQWVTTAKAAGMQELILTAKHHDGFCLWPSQYNEHNISKSPYKNGQGDIVQDFVDACAKHGLKAGLYLSPWDRNHADYGMPAYIEYYRNQLRELLTNYGEINEIWFDGANGGDGYYGGANEIRKIDRDQYYDWENTFAIAKEIQPNIKIFSDAGPDVHWIGNEHGFAGETFWSTMNLDSVSIGTSNTDYLNSGDPNGDSWVVGQCDVSIRPGWFYHESQDSLVKTPQELMDIYYKSVGRNAILLLNLPPDKRGLIHERDVQSLLEFKSILDDTFKDDLAKTGTASASEVWNQSKNMDPKQVLDDDLSTYWAANDSTKSATLEIGFPEVVEFDHVVLQEPIHLGQAIEAFEIEVLIDDEWQDIATATTIGYKRILRFDPVKTSKLRVLVQQSRNTIALSTVSIYNSGSQEN